jgi:CelD/BcsL family acetyltransferase involved in cellulose biosynthesis
MKITSSLITNVTELAHMEKDLTAFLNRCSTNPFLLYSFIEYLMRKTSKDSIPAILVIKNGEKIIGLAPLVLKQHFGFRGVTSLVKPTGSPDLIVEKEYQEKVMKHLLFVLLKKMRCTSIILNLPAESPNLKALELECRSNKIAFYTSIDQNMNHCVLPVQGSWPDFLNSISGKYKRKFKMTQRRLSEVGEWKSVFIETSDDDQSANDALSKIHAVEKMSWKEDWRLQAGHGMDQDLEGIWKTSRLLVKANPDFKLMIWFLELSDRPVAYSLVIQYKGTAWIVKTSFADEYRCLSLGIYVVNAAIQDLFSKGTVQKIDFMTDLPFMKTWHPLSMPRVKFKIVTGNLPTLSRFVRDSPIGPMLYRTPILSTFVSFTE